MVMIEQMNLLMLVQTNQWNGFVFVKNQHQMEMVSEEDFLTLNYELRIQKMVLHI